MSAIKEHFHDKIQTMHYEDYYSKTPEQAAITARAETLKEVIYFCEQEIYAYERLFSALGNPDELRGQVKTAKKIKEHYQQRLNELSL